MTIRILVTVLCLCLCVSLSASSAALAGSAKILLYHHVSSDTPASTSVTPEVFDSHLQLLEESGYEVIPLAKIVALARPN